MSISEKSLQNIRVLYCEDNESERSETLKILRRHYEYVYEASNGVEALDIFRSSPVDIILTDIGMSKMNGLDLAKAARSIRSDIPIIFMTGRADASTMIESIDLGIDKYLVKPISIMNLLDSINAISAYKILTKELELKNRALYNLHNQLEMVMGIANIGFCIMDSGYNMKFINLSWEKKYGSIRGKKCYEYFGCEIESCEECRVVSVLNDGEWLVFEKRIAIDPEKIFQVTACRIHDENGDWAISEIFLDLTEQRRREEEIGRKNRELFVLNQTLEERVAESIEKQRKQDKLMLIQSRQAAMGEMIGNIAHQWRQPLNSLGMLIQNIEDRFNNQLLTSEYMQSAVEKGIRLAQYMSQTIDDFRSFFKPEKEKSDFDIRQSIEKAMTIMEGSFKTYSIETRFEGVLEKTKYLAFGFSNEFIQVLINIFNNAKEMFLLRDIKNPKIEIRFAQEDGKLRLSIIDNAGGISDGAVGKIFEPYFTTKGSGTGIGLYMSKVIIEEHHNGRLLCRNVDRGAEFIIELDVKVG